MFGGCKPSPYRTGGIAVTTSSGEARRHSLARFSLALHRSTYPLTLPQTELVRLTFTAAAADAERTMAEVASFLGVGCQERVVSEGRVALDFWCEPGTLPAPEALAQWMTGVGVEADIERAEETDEWRDAMRAFHKPVEIAGRLRIRPPWEPADPDLLDLVVDPGMAFGTGQHTTTRGCIELLSSVEPGPLLDVGCGTGILAMAARRFGHNPVWAFDVDPLAVDATIENARANGVGLTVARRTLGQDPLPRVPTVVANLTATLLRVLALELAGSPPRVVIVSGIRPDEAQSVLDSFRPLGLAETARVGDKEWLALMLRI
jgi:ribosomal protein L11 methyltransferase